MIVECACGAHWQGSAIKAGASYIALHRERERLGQIDPAFRKPCKVTERPYDAKRDKLLRFRT